MRKQHQGRDRYVDANLKWHLDVAEASENRAVLMTSEARFLAALHTATDLEVFDEKTRKVVVGVHWTIFEAIRVGDPEAARRRMIRHLTAYGDKLSSTNLWLSEERVAVRPPKADVADPASSRLFHVDRSMPNDRSTTIIARIETRIMTTEAAATIGSLE